MKTDPYKLRAYHNPKSIDESKVPDGWRFRYADEMFTRALKCRFWSTVDKHWKKAKLDGLDKLATYIVPVA
jgi:hypothetical protein